MPSRQSKFMMKGERHSDLGDPAFRCPSGPGEKLSPVDLGRSILIPVMRYTECSALRWISSTPLADSQLKRPNVVFSLSHLLAVFKHILPLFQLPHTADQTPETPLNDDESKLSNLEDGLTIPLGKFTRVMPKNQIRPRQSEMDIPNYINSTPVVSP